MSEANLSNWGWLRKRLEQAEPDFLRDLLQTTVEKLMGAEADGIYGASYGEVIPDRVNYRNGYRERRWDTRLGSMALAIGHPQVA